MPSHTGFADDPIRLLQHLIRFDTTNPPGNERECVLFINALLHEAGFDTTFLSRDPRRPNLITRLEGAGTVPPLLLYGHVDVVSTAGQQWRHPPFDALIAEDMVWGRGALDMKGGVAMMLSALLRARRDERELPGDVVLAILSDEEDRSEFGARFLVEHHAEEFGGIRHAIGEFGGFSITIEGIRFYPIMVAEKSACRVRITARGEGGHGSIPVRGGAMGRLGKILTALERYRPPVRVTPVARMMVESIAAELPAARALLLRRLLNPRIAAALLERLSGPLALFAPLLRTTLSPTVIHSGSGINVIPSEVVLEVDARVLPGVGVEELRAELSRALRGIDCDVEIDADVLAPAEPDMSGFERLAGILRESDPSGVPIPMLLPGITDARFFNRLGIQTYGYLPMTLPEGMNFTKLLHAADERIPVAALEFGTRAIAEAMARR